MASTVLYMSMSLDGFIAGPNVRPDNGLGDEGERLHEWVFSTPQGDAVSPSDFAGPDGEVNRAVVAEFMSTGAAIAGRGTFEPAGGWSGDHHDGVPIYILSRHDKPDWMADWPLVHYGDDLESLVRSAKDAAGERNVLVHGSSIAQRMIPAGLLDELVIHLVPLLLGDGTRLFEHLGAEPRQLERVSVLEGEHGVTHLRYRLHA